VQPINHQNTLYVNTVSEGESTAIANLKAAAAKGMRSMMTRKKDASDMQAQSDPADLVTEKPMFTNAIQEGEEDAEQIDLIRNQSNSVSEESHDFDDEKLTPLRD
jgi:hypothetical protein